MDFFFFASFVRLRRHFCFQRLHGSMCRLLDRPRSVFTSSKMSLRLLLFFSHWFGSFHQILSFFPLSYSKQKHWLIRLDLCFKCSSFVLDCVCTTNLQMLVFVPPSDSVRASFFFFFFSPSFPFMLSPLPRRALCCVRQLRMEPFCLLQFLKWNISLLNAYLSCPTDCARRTNTHSRTHACAHTHAHTH